MSFPASPTNGQTTSINGKTYVYNSTKDAWEVAVTSGSVPGTLITPAGTISGNLVVTGNLTVSENAAVTNNITANSNITANVGNIVGNLTVGGILTDNYYYANGSAFSGGGGGGGGGVNSLEEEIEADTPYLWYKLNEESGADVTNYGSAGSAGNLTLSGTYTRNFTNILPNSSGTATFTTGTTTGASGTAAGLSTPISGSWTIESVFVPLADGTNQINLLNFTAVGETEATNFQFSVRVSGTGNISVFWERGAGTNETISTGTSLENGRPYHLVVVKNSSNKTIQTYVNGIKLANTSYTNEPTGGSSGVVSIGYNGTTTETQSPRIQSHTVYYQSILSESRIQAHALSAFSSNTVTGSIVSNNLSVSELTVSNSASVVGNLTVGGILTNNYYYANGSAVPSLTSATAQATTSGTVKDFNDIPSWVKKITVMLSGVSTNGSNNILIQIGTSSGIEATGYISTMGVINAGVASQGTSTTGFMVSSQTAARTAYGIVTISLLGSNLWVYNSVVRSDTTVIAYGAGDKTLSGTLDRVRVTSTGSTDTFDAGSVNILYE